MQLTYSSDPKSELNTARWYWQMARTMRRYANRGYGCKRAAARHWNISRARLKRAMTGARPLAKFDADFETTVAGIPCGVVITGYVARRDWKQHAFPGTGPGDCDPPEPPEVDWFIVDSKGYVANWLTDRADRERDRITSEAFDHLGL